VAQWLLAGALLVWIVNPRHRTIAVRTSAEKVSILSATDDLLGGEILPGFRWAVSELFP